MTPVRPATRRTPNPSKSTPPPGSDMTTTRNQRRAGYASPHLARGLSLIELMIALLLGLVVTAADGGMLPANKRAYASPATLNRHTETTRGSFDLMSRALREAVANNTEGHTF